MPNRQVQRPPGFECRIHPTIGRNDHQASRSRCAGLSPAQAGTEEVIAHIISSVTFCYGE